MRIDRRQEFLLVREGREIAEVGFEARDFFDEVGKILDPSP